MIRFRRVAENLYRGGSPTPEDVKILHNKFGVEKIVSLDLEAGSRINLVCGLLSIEHLIFPIDVEKKITLIPFLRNLDEIFKLDVPTFVHCKIGRDRTGLAIALYRCQFDGWPFEKALKEAQDLGFGQELPKHIVDLFTKLMKDHCAKKEIDDNEADDIVSGGRLAGTYDDYYQGGSNLSWSPFQDRAVREWPFSPVELRNYDSPDDTRQNHNLNELDGVDTDWIKNQVQVPQTGQYQDFQSITNALGPSAVGGGFV